MCQILKLKKKIIKSIKSLKSKNSHGYDEISVKILKLSSQFITSPLPYTYNKSPSTGAFPTRLKFSVVKPLHKKGDRTNIPNFRPISLLASFSKIFQNFIQGVTGGTDQTSGECSLGQTIPI